MRAVVRTHAPGARNPPAVVQTEKDPDEDGRGVSHGSRSRPAARVALVVGGDTRVTALAVGEQGTVAYATYLYPVTTILRADGNGIVSTVFEDGPGACGGSLGETGRGAGAVAGRRA